MSNDENENELESDVEIDDVVAEQIQQRAFDRQYSKEREARRVNRQMGDTLDDRWIGQIAKKIDPIFYSYCPSSVAVTGWVALCVSSG